MTRPASSDSRKMPIALLSFAQADPIKDETLTWAYAKSPVDNADLLSTKRGGIIPWENVESFSYAFNKSSDDFAVAKFTLFDPEYDRILAVIFNARERGEYIRAYFRYGWVVDGSEPNLSPIHSGMIVSVEPTAQADGMRIVLSISSPQFIAKMTERTYGHWPAGTPADVVVKQVLESEPKAATAVNKNLGPVEVYTPVPCRPIPKDLVCQDQSALFFVLSQVLPYAVAVDPRWHGRPMRIRENNGLGLVQQDGKHFTFAPEGFTEADVSELRDEDTYVINRGGDGRCISFQPSDDVLWANMIGGLGHTIGVDSAKGTPLRSYMPSITGDFIGRRDKPAPLVSLVPPTPEAIYFAKATHDRNPEALVAARQRVWEVAQSAATECQAEVVGDPSVRQNDIRRFLLYKNGTTSTLGLARRAEDDASSKTGPQLVSYFSGDYLVLNYEHNISNGVFTTKMTLIPKPRNTNEGTRSSAAPSLLTPDLEHMTAEELRSVGKARYGGLD